MSITQVCAHNGVSLNRTPTGLFVTDREGRHTFFEPLDWNGAFDAYLAASGQSTAS